MSTKARSLWKRILYIVGAVILAAVGVFVGIRMERERQEALELQKEHVSAIAIVNMDNGVMVGDREVNYAGQLLSFPNDRFTVTGLTDARTGIENGRYAAYIVIPETFSASVTSVENDPAKVMLAYQYNTKLGEEEKLQAVSDVDAFMVLLNSNIAYMYMDAIMVEFHRIQDESSTILANDNMELELIADINAEELIAAAVPVEELQVSEDIQPVDLSSYSSRNAALLNDMLAGYSAAVQKGKDDYAVIKEESAGVGAASENFFGLYDTVIRETAEEQTRALEEGQEKLIEAVGLHNEGIGGYEEEVREVTAKILSLQLEADREAAESQLQEILAEQKGDVSENNPGNAEITLSAVNDEEAVNSVVNEILGLFQAKSESEEIDAVIRTCFVDALSEANSRQMERMTEEMETVKGTMASYENRLADYDPMKYVEEADLSAYLSSIDVNAGEMLRAVEQNNSDYMLYATQMYTSTTEHTTQVESALDEANTQTVKNVADCMNDLALSRQEVNSVNVDLLMGFTESLAYTRVGSQENAEVYDYIINPVVPRINGQPVTDTETETERQREYPVRIWLILLLGAAILLCLAAVIVNLRREYGGEEEDEGAYLTE